MAEWWRSYFGPIWPAGSIEDPFAAQNYSLWWIQWVYNHRVVARLPGHLRWVIPALLRSVLMFLVGMAIAIPGGFHHLYLCLACSWPVYAALFGLFFYPLGVLTLIGYLSRLKTIEELLSKAESPDLGQLVTKWSLRASDNRRSSLWAVIGVGIVVPLGTWLWLAEANQPFFSALRFMPDVRWYQENLLAKVLLLDVFGVVVVADTIVSFRVISCHFGLSRDLSNLELESPLLVTVAARRFQSLSRWNAWMAANYSVGLWLVVLVWARFPSTPVFAMIGLIILFNIGVVALPQFNYRKLINREREQLLTTIETVTMGSLASPGVRLNRNQLQDFNLLGEATERAQAAGIWVFEFPLALINPSITLTVAGIQIWLASR